jgi:hypothetical protein
MPPGVQQEPLCGPYARSRTPRYGFYPLMACDRLNAGRSIFGPARARRRSRGPSTAVGWSRFWVLSEAVSSGANYARFERRSSRMTLMTEMAMTIQRATSRTAVTEVASAT